MEIFLPDNIFSRILSTAFNEKDTDKLYYFPSGLLSKKINETRDAVGLIPTLDLINHEEFFVSKNLGISFDESISNSYIYFNQSEKLVNEVVLAGDVSFNEGVLSKILFHEIYAIDVQLSFEKTNGGTADKTIIMVGDRNFVEGNIDAGISFTEEIIEIISAPYVNFVFVSRSEDLLKKFQSKYQNIISQISIVGVLEKFSKVFSSSSQKYLLENLQHVLFIFDGQDLEGIKQVLQLPYYHGIIKDMIDLKLV
jgi:hypothetical protein